MKFVKAVLLVLVFSSAAWAGEDIRKITVTGRSKITLPAQYAVIDTEMRFVEKDINTGHQRLETALAEMIGRLKEIGMVDTDIIKSIVMQGPQYTWKKQERIATGYFAACNVNVRVNDMAKIRFVHDALSRFNALTVRSTRYGRNDTFKMRNAEMEKALLAAKRKAALMAGVLDAELGPVFRIEEHGAGAPAPVNVLRMSAAGEKSGGTFGSVDIEAVVSVVFELIPK